MHEDGMIRNLRVKRPGEVHNQWIHGRDVGLLSSAADSIADPQSTAIVDPARFACVTETNRAAK